MHCRGPGPGNATDRVTDPHRATIVSTGETLHFSHYDILLRRNRRMEAGFPLIGRSAEGAGADGAMGSPSAPVVAGYLSSRPERWWCPGEVIRGLRSIAAPVVGTDGTARAALAVVYVDADADTDVIGAAVAEAAAKVSAAMT